MNTSTSLIVGFVLALATLVGCAGLDVPNGSTSDDGKTQSCVPGQTNGCTTADGKSGSQTCNSEGTAYGVCTAYASNMTCTPGQSINATCPTGPGSQTCNASGTGYNACVPFSTGQVCVPGISSPCTCNGQPGSMVCNPDGKSYGPCNAIQTNQGTGGSSSVSPSTGGSSSSGTDPNVTYLARYTPNDKIAGYAQAAWFGGMLNGGAWTYFCATSPSLNPTPLATMVRSGNEWQCSFKAIPGSELQMNANVAYSVGVSAAGDPAVNGNQSFACWEDWSKRGQCGQDYKPSGTLTVTNTKTNVTVTINTPTTWGADVTVFYNQLPACGCNLTRLLP